MAKQGIPGEKQFDPMLILALGILIFFMVWVLWFRFHTPLALFYSWVRTAEFGVFWLLGEAVSSLSTPFHDWVDFFLKADKSRIEWRHLTASSLLANIFILLLAVIPLAYRMAKKSLNTNPYNHLHFGKIKDYSLHSFTDTMAAVYPHLKLFRKLNLTNKPINSGKYRLADTEKQFAIKHDLLDKVKPRDFKVNRERSGGMFRSQLGRPWTGFGNLTPSEFAVIAALVPRLAATDVTMSEKDYKTALETTKQLIRDYWRSAADSYSVETDTLEVDLGKAKESIRKYKDHPNVKKYINAHAYVATVIYRMIHESRVLGVLQPADFRWLRVTDRRLWLFVDNVGRIVSTTEVAGIYAHFLHELHQKRALEKPVVDNAVVALIDAVDGFAFSDAEVLEIDEKAKQVEAAKAGIDVKAVGTAVRNVFLAFADVDGRLIEAAVVAEDGKTLFSGRCKIDKPLSSGDQARLGLTEEVAKGLRDEPVTAEALKKRILEVCNGLRVIAFGKSVVAMVPGIDRSSAEVVDLRGQLQTIGKSDGESLEQALQALNVSADVTKAEKWSIAEGLRARVVWVELEKRRLQAEREKEKNTTEKSLGSAK